jgi:DNA-binding NtrC family response regulator
MPGRVTFGQPPGLLSLARGVRVFPDCAAAAHGLDCGWLMASLGRVLVIDDDSDVALLLRDALAEFGYTVKVSATGSEALPLVAAYKPDVVLLDLWLPGVPGEQILRDLRERDAALPVVIITGNRDPEIAQAVLDMAFDFIPKPFDIAVIEQVVAAAIVERERRLR